MMSSQMRGQRGCCRVSADGRGEWRRRRGGVSLRGRWGRYVAKGRERPLARGRPVRRRAHAAQVVALEGARREPLAASQRPKRGWRWGRCVGRVHVWRRAAALPRERHHAAIEHSWWPRRREVRLAHGVLVPLGLLGAVRIRSRWHDGACGSRPEGGCARRLAAVTLTPQHGRRCIGGLDGRAAWRRARRRAGGRHADQGTTRPRRKERLLVRQRLHVGAIVALAEFARDDLGPCGAAREHRRQDVEHLFSDGLSSDGSTQAWSASSFAGRAAG